MKKSTILWLSILLVAIISTAVYGLNEKKSLVNNIYITKHDIERANDLSVTTIPYENNQFFKNNVTSIEQLEKFSDTVIKVKLFDSFKSQRFYFSTLTPVQVLNVYKGDSLKPNDIINIFELFYFGKEDCKTQDGYNMMIKNHEYILFLKKSKNPSYNVEGNKDFLYTPISSMYAKYDISSKTPVKIININNIKYKDVKDFEIITLNKKVVDKYLQFKGQVIKKYEDK
ncbi:MULTISPECIES: hypothetical protein [Clostridium]|uniref:Uncharacterized protein n=1 Tax=Clostridium novyi B str. ATCC 27606 TaxID=1443123 RepID=A0AA40M4B7_CLONO|nr:MULTISPECIES: hypothetical protein [Clostridium]KEI07997.1 hypothetical protein Z958_p0188 [Clostridium novyi B str. NCTC 9691]KEI11408.1 hypothetical protein Z959_p0111 [Clostridium novyi B str. ATCC 27606]OOB76421.1 hypothetical protein AXF41_12300 [Clostridium haemolyticum]